MKSNTAFFISIACYLLLMYLLSIFMHYDIDHNQQRPIIIPIANAVLGLAVLGLTLSKEQFKLFVILFLSFWTLIGFFTIIAIAFPKFSIGKHTFHTIHISSHMISDTFLDTPLPFIFYWLFIKANNYIK